MRVGECDVSTVPALTQWMREAYILFLVFQDCIRLRLISVNHGLKRNAVLLILNLRALYLGEQKHFVGAMRTDVGAKATPDEATNATPVTVIAELLVHHVAPSWQAPLRLLEVTCVNGAAIDLVCRTYGMPDGAVCDCSAGVFF